jgi:hypothetical protein
LRRGICAIHFNANTSAASLAWAAWQAAWTAVKAKDVALQKLMAKLADLLDEDQFAHCENIVRQAGIEPPAGAKE